MYQNYNYYPQAQQQNAYLRQPSAGAQQTPYFLKGHPVSSLEEAKASSIDFDGSLFFFPDIANKRIYTKQINLDGTSAFNIYEYKEIPPDALISNPDYITRNEFEQAVSQLKSMLTPPEPPQQIQEPRHDFNF